MFKNLNADQSIHRELGGKGSMGDSAPSISPTSIRSPTAKTAQPMQVCCLSRDPSRWSASLLRAAACLIPLEPDVPRGLGTSQQIRGVHGGVYWSTYYQSPTPHLHRNEQYHRGVTQPLACQCDDVCGSLVGYMYAHHIICGCQDSRDLGSRDPRIQADQNLHGLQCLRQLVTPSMQKVCAISLFTPGQNIP
jgi:hypothetical protein